LNEKELDFVVGVILGWIAIIHGFDWRRFRWFRWL